MFVILLVMRKFQSLPCNLNKMDTFIFNYQHLSCNNFNDLYLKGQQPIMTFGKSMNKNKNTRKKIIENFYKNLYK